MKIAVTAQGPDLDSPVDPRFGRAKCFLVVDTESGQSAAHSNEQNVGAVQGAGIQAARTVIGLGVAAVVTGNVGPKAFATLQAGDVAVYTGAGGSVKQAVEQFKAGNLKAADGANVEGHWV
jgi:predicted Fe-Mo cluster-binding NifX family protein